MIRFILLDIEGTTTDVRFVHQVLFPYARQHLEAYVLNHLDSPFVQENLKRVKETVLSEDRRQIDNNEAIAYLLKWIDTDRKHTALKALQGELWRTGYEQGEYQSHLYPDVIEALKRWQQAGIEVGIYSSGSVQAQKLLFQYTPYGNLNPFFSHYFDTRIGAKQDPKAYATIAEQLNRPANEILFLSDIEAELAAAHSMGFSVGLLAREASTLPDSRFPVYLDFSSILQTPSKV